MKDVRFVECGTLFMLASPADKETVYEKVRDEFKDGALSHSIIIRRLFMSDGEWRVVSRAKEEHCNPYASSDEIKIVI